MQASHKLTTELFSGGGEMGERMRSLDWSRTPLGEPASWPKSLRMAVRILLGTGYPMYIAWGPEFIQFYNDAYRPILGSTKHPGALGASTPDTFKEIWDFIGPMFHRVMDGGEATTLVDQSLFFDRRGYVEENYFTFSYSPIPSDDESTIGGVLVTVIETTERILEERRLRTLKDLAARAAEIRGEQQVWRNVAETLGTNPHDLPFVLLYRYDASLDEAFLEGATGLRAEDLNAPTSIGPGDGRWPVHSAMREPVLLRQLAEKYPELPTGAWTQAPNSAVILPIGAPAQGAPVGFLIAGLNPHKSYEAEYQLFLERVVTQISHSITEARTYEAERRRAELLAELDKAKTTFFSNISHEFRTPLTLIVGPLEETLATDGLSGASRERLEMAHRNTLRLLKLVNNLLDFSRIETGRIQAVFEPTDVAGFTAELVSGFRSACERAGLLLSMTSGPIERPVYLDRDMWEKIVLNLLSNAFKFTFEGGIAVDVQPVGEQIELSVADTGTGVPEAELPHLFERFYRVQGAKGRSYEGSGIGLALVQELVKLHGGTISVESKENVGTRFRVRIPIGTAHLPAEALGRVRQNASTATRIESFVHEALRWIPDSNTATGVAVDLAQETTPTVHTEAVRGRSILVVDDNLDMREYAARLLRDHFTVQTAADGRQAWELIQRKAPDLVLSDIMMPGMDGLELLEAIRTDPSTQLTPVILLSARAGEESRVEGLVAGADDYLVKPFTARELLARVTAHLEIAKIRQVAESSLRESEARFRSLVEQSPISTVVYDKEGQVLEANAAFSNLWGIRLQELPLNYNVMHDAQLESLGILPEVRKAFEGQAVHISTFYYDLKKTTSTGKGSNKWIEMTMYPVRNSQGHVTNVVVLHTDVTARVEAEQALAITEQRAEREAKRVREVLESTSDAVFMLDRSWNFTYLNKHAVTLVASGRDLLGKNIWEEFPDAVGREFWKQYHRAMDGRVVTEFEEFYPEPLNGWYNVHAYPTEEGIAVFFHEITERKRAEHALRQSEKLAAAGRLAASISHEINNPLEAVTNLLYLLENSSTLSGTELRYLKMAQSELNRVSQIATQTLRFYRQSTRPSEAVLSDILDSVIELFRPRMNDAGVRVETKFGTTSPITAFVGELRQVFTNIIANALDATRPGGKILVRVRQDREWRTGRQGIRVTVADTGQGMSYETIRHIFEPFFTTKGNTGTGLGLWVSHEIIEKHAGVVRVRSSQKAERHGTVFSVFFPVQEVPTA